MSSNFDSILGTDYKGVMSDFHNSTVNLNTIKNSSEANKYFDDLNDFTTMALKYAFMYDKPLYDRYVIYKGACELVQEFAKSGKTKYLNKKNSASMDFMPHFYSSTDEEILEILSPKGTSYTLGDLLENKNNIQKSKEEELRKFEEEKAQKEAEQKRIEEEQNKNTTPIETPTPPEEKRDEFGKVETPIDTVDEKAKALEELNNGIKNGLSNISISMGEDGNPVINGRVGYTYDDTKLTTEELNKVISDRLNEALIPFLQSSSFSTAQKINALDNFFINNPNYTNADLYNIVKFKNNLYSDINKIATSTLSDDEKSLKMKELAIQYEMFVSNNKNIFPFALSDMWNDFDIDEDLSNRGLLKLAIDTTVDGQELSKALDMYISNKSIYDEAIKNYENMVNSYTPDKLENLGNEYGDIESKYNAQKVDKQATNTALGLGQSNAIATQLGNQAQYQNYAENLAENQMSQTDNVTDYAQNKLDNEYAKVQNAYNNAASAENAVMGEVDKNQADINAYLTKKGVDLATDKYNYERKMQPVQVATNVASSAINAVDKLKNSNNN